jgi:hypothetical protein
VGFEQGEAMSLSLKRAKLAAAALKTWRFPWGWLSETHCPAFAAAPKEQVLGQLALLDLSSTSRHSSLSSSTFSSQPSSSCPSSPVDEAEAHRSNTQNGACAPSEESSFEAQKSFCNGSPHWHQPTSGNFSHEARSQSFLNGLGISSLSELGPWGRITHSPLSGGEGWRRSVWFGQASWALQCAALVHSEPAAKVVTETEKKVRVWQKTDSDSENGYGLLFLVYCLVFPFVSSLFILPFSFYFEKEKNCPEKCL